jgi:hypothetical protein
MRRAFARWPCAVLAALFLIAWPWPAAARVTVKITLDGVVRQALVDPGKDAATTPSPLVFVFHGASVTAMFMTQFGLSMAFVGPDGSEPATPMSTAESERPGSGGPIPP